MSRWATKHEVFLVEFDDGSGCVLRVSLAALVGMMLLVLGLGLLAWWA